MKRTLLTTLAVGAAVVGAQPALAAEPANDPVTAYLVQSGLMSAPVSPDTVRVPHQVAAQDAAEAYLIQAGLVEPRTSEDRTPANEAIALEPAKRYLLEINSQNYVEIVESLPRG